MSLQKLNIRTVVLILMIVAAAAFRLLSYDYKILSNFTPLGAIAIFGGVYFTDKWKAYVAVLLAYVLSDMLINALYGLPLLSDYTILNCICFAIVVSLGILIKKINFTSILLIIIAPVAIHWLIMDLPWVVDYPKTLAGYGAALIAAIPFEKNMFFGDMVFGFILFGGFELAKSKYVVLRTNKELAV